MTDIDNENIFLYELDNLVKLINSQKGHIFHFIKKHFKENIHYKLPEGKKNGKKYCCLLTKETYELTLNTYNIKNRYNPHNQKNILMSLENQTIGFIENIFKNVIKTERQKIFGVYKVDLYFEEYKLVIECDEFNHKDRDIFYEKKRENYIKSLNNTFIRFNPNQENFDLSIVINKINNFIFNYKDFKSL